MRIEKGQTYTISGNVDMGEVIENYGTLKWDEAKNSRLIGAKNIINYGILQMKPLPNVVHELGWRGIDNSKYQGGGMVPLDSDIGLWNMAAGVMDIKATYKKSWTFIVGGCKKGDTKILMMDVTGWLPNDDLVFGTTEKPDAESRSWNSDFRRYEDNFIERFERRKIVRVEGIYVIIDRPLSFDHNVVVTEPNDEAPSGRVFFPCVLNNTRNVKIHGESASRTAHIFSCAHEYDASGKVTAHFKQLHSIDGAEVYWMGVRKLYPNSDKGEDGIHEIVTGRYVMHFHHAGDGSAGTVVKNCAFHDNNGRCFVPHLANGITLEDSNISFNLGDACWWDFQEMSHNITYQRNCLAAILWDGVQLGGTAMLLGIGDNCKVLDNYLIYAHQGDPDGAGAMQWTTDNEGVWLTERNYFFSNKTGIWPWQNSGRAHAITRCIYVNNVFAITHGAYGNSYTYDFNEFYNSPVKWRASGSIYGGASLHRCVFDGMNITKETARAMTSAVAGWNQFRQCHFKNTDVAVAFDTYPGNGTQAQWRGVEIINCKFTNVKQRLKFVNWSNERPGEVFLFQPGLAGYIQDGNTAIRILPGFSGRTITQTESPVAKFAPDKFGTGDGLNFQIYKGMKFETLLLQNIRSIPREQDWRPETPKFPNGPHYKLLIKNADGTYSVSAFSARYWGHIEPYYTAPHRFRLNGGSGFRLWIDDKLVIDSEGNKHDNSEYRDSPWINLTAFKKVPIKIEVYEPGDRNMGIWLSWEAQNIFTMRDPEMSQYYSGATSTPIQPPLPTKKTVVKTVITYTDGTQEIII